MKIAVVGAAGRMGQMLVRRIAATEGMTLGGASESPNSNAIGRDAGELAGLEACGVKITKDSAAAIAARYRMVASWMPFPTGAMLTEFLLRIKAMVATTVTLR